MKIKVTILLYILCIKPKAIYACHAPVVVEAAAAAIVITYYTDFEVPQKRPISLQQLYTRNHLGDRQRNLQRVEEKKN